MGAGAATPERTLLEKSLAMVSPEKSELSDTVSSCEPLDPAAERKLVWKVDCNVIPILSLIL
jgi:hypothetical protein